MIHGMLDIETADTEPTARILTVGFLLFDPYGDGSEDKGYHWVVPDSLNVGRTINIDTLRWWLRQGELARSQAFLAQQAEPNKFLEEFGEVVKQAEVVWANDPDFDCVLMNNFLKPHGMRLDFRKNRSIRTLRGMFDFETIISPSFVAHNALEDCKYQADTVRQVYQDKAVPVYRLGIN